MKNTDHFSGYHPIVNFLYFTLVLLFTMFFMHPLYLVISLLCALIYAIYLNGGRAMRFSLFYMVPMLLLTALINPAFNHEGATILTYLPSGNPLTLESIIYGIGAALMLVAVILWFSCYNKIMTSDKFVYLFGRIIPALSLVLSMVLRFVPKFKAQFQAVSRAQKCVGRDISDGSLFHRMKNGVTILSIMVTWSLENAIETADSMKSRGYGLPGRTAFSIYRFDKRDGAALACLLGSSAYVLLGAACGALKWRYFPTIKGVELGLFPISVALVFLSLCAFPVLLNIAADRKWARLQGDNFNKGGVAIHGTK